MVVEVSLMEFWEMTQSTLNPNCYVIMKGGHWVALMMSLAKSAAHIPSPPPLIEMGTLGGVAVFTYGRKKWCQPLAV